MNSTTKLIKPSVTEIVKNLVESASGLVECTAHAIQNDQKIPTFLVTYAAKQSSILARILGLELEELKAWQKGGPNELKKRALARALILALQAKIDQRGGEK